MFHTAVLSVAIFRCFVKQFLDVSVFKSRKSICLLLTVGINKATKIHAHTTAILNSYLFRVQISGSEKRSIMQDCGGGNYKCDSGDCIPREKACDRHYDCADGSDELRCGQFRRVTVFP